MKKLDVSSITDSSRMPVKKGTLQFLQDSYTEVVAMVMQALIGTSYDPTKVYIVYGGVNVGTYPIYDISAGVVFYNGELFALDLSAFTATGANVAVFQIITTQYTVDADPVTFTDSAVRSIHNIRKMQILQGATGSQLANYSDAIFLNLVIPAELNLTTTGGATVTGTYPNKVVNATYMPKDTIVLWPGNVAANFDSTGLATSGQWQGWALANGQNGTIDMRGHVPVGLTNADNNNYGYTNPVKNDADFNTVGANGGEKEHTLVDGELPSTVKVYAPLYNQGHGATAPLVSDSASLDQIGNDQPHNNMQPYVVLAYIQKIVA